MKEYHKINSVYKRDPQTNRFIEGEWSCAEFGYLQDCQWGWEEKIDGCLHYNNLVNTDDGLLPIGRIVEKELPVRVFSYNERTEVVELKNILHYHQENRCRPFINVRVRSRRKGRRAKSIVCTGNHMFFTDNGWREAGDLKVGDRVAILDLPLSYQTRQIILGTLLGDSSIYRPSPLTRGFSFSHAAPQKDYFTFKMTLLKSLVRECRGTTGGFPGSTPNRRANSIVTPAISDLILRLCEVDNRKIVTEAWVDELTPIAIAIWFLDDGSCMKSKKQRPRARIATNAYNNIEVGLLVETLTQRFGLHCRSFNGKTYKGNTIVFSAEGTEKLFSLIAPYVPSMMKYKLGNTHKDTPLLLTEEVAPLQSTAWTEVVDVNAEFPCRFRGHQSQQYDLSVEGNSNYFADDVLVHNTNIRVMWDGQQTRFGGKTDNASIPAPLVARLIELFPREKFIQHFPRLPDNAEACLYGEGYGTKIQKGGGNYKADGVDFILFDVRVGNWWLRREDVAGIAESLGVRMVPFVQSGNLIEAIDYVKHGECPSAFGAFQMEGLVCRPLIELFARNGERIITKVKCRDFR